MNEVSLIEFLAVGLVLTLVSIVVWRHLDGQSAIVRLAVVAIPLVGYFGAAFAYRGSMQASVAEADVTDRPTRVLRDGYVGSETCRSCHQVEYGSWHSSYHRTMTQVADASSVVAGFDNTVLTMSGVNYEREYKLSRTDGEYSVEIGPVLRPDTPNSNSKDLPTRHKIVMTTGSHHMQGYWYDSGDGRNVGMLPFVYLIDEQRWIPRYAAFIRPPDSPVDEPHGRWNTTCIKCHTTHGILGREEQHDPHPQTTVAEFGISCEACHGPGEEHVRLNRNPVRRYQYHLTSRGDSTAAHPKRLDKATSADVCGQCHSNFIDKSIEAYRQWEKEGFRFRPGNQLEDFRFIVRREQKRPDVIQSMIDKDPLYLDAFYWPDGMIRVSGREYNGLLDTPCFVNGDLSCLSCHTMHQGPGDSRSTADWTDDQLGPGMRTNRACTQCHPGFDKDEALTAHTHHPPKSSGSLCYNCHMPHTTYGLLKGIRSHTIDSPSVAKTLETGRPNACNLCHLDKTLAWTADQMTSLYDQPDVAVPSEHQDLAASLVWLIKGDAGQRALLAWHMSWKDAQQAAGSHWMAPHLATLFTDPYPAVRVIAQRSLKGLPGVSESERAQFDVTWPAATRLHARHRIYRHWREWARTRNVEWPSRLLYNPAGTFKTDSVARLLKYRDDRRMLLNE